MPATIYAFPLERVATKDASTTVIEKPVFRLADLLAGFRSQDPGVLTLFRKAYAERSRVPELPESDCANGMVRLLAILLRQPIQASEAALPHEYAARSECGFDLFSHPFWANVRSALATIFSEKPEVIRSLEQNMFDCGEMYLPTHLETLLMWYYENKSVHPFEGGR